MKTSATNITYGVVASALILAGCQQSEPMAATPTQPQAAVATAAPAPQPGRIAVFDIDHIADQTGMVQEMQKKILAKKEELQKDLEEFSKKLRTTLEAEGKKLKKDKDLKKKAMALEQGAALKFRQGQAEADQALNIYRLRLISEIRDVIRPVAREVAYGKGFDVILLRNDTVVFDVKDEVELTNEILMAYQTRHPEAVKKPEPAAATEKPAPAKK
jgi:Skp family chaperone for outer membrane proteins